MRGRRPQSTSEGDERGNVGLCLLTRLAVLCLLSNRLAMNGAPTSPDEALHAWQQLANAPVRCSIPLSRLRTRPRSWRCCQVGSPRPISGPMLCWRP